MVVSVYLAAVTPSAGISVTGRGTSMISCHSTFGTPFSGRCTDRKPSLMIVAR
jgi:hypothetical protein